MPWGKNAQNEKSLAPPGPLFLNSPLLAPFIRRPPPPKMVPCLPPRFRSWAANPYHWPLIAWPRPYNGPADSMKFEGQFFFFFFFLFFFFSRIPRACAFEIGVVCMALAIVPCPQKSRPPSSPSGWGKAPGAPFALFPFLTWPCFLSVPRLQSPPPPPPSSPDVNDGPPWAGPLEMRYEPNAPPPFWLEGPPALWALTRPRWGPLFLDHAGRVLYEPPPLGV